MIEVVLNPPSLSVDIGILSIGQKGEKGDTGQDGASVSVNGKAAVEGNITLLADDVSAYTKSEVDVISSNKVDKINGKGLSTNDLTDILKGNYDSAVTNNHIHNNKSILDGTQESFTTLLKSTYDSKQNSLGFTPENSSNKGQSNGYASLDNSGKVPSTQLSITLEGLGGEPANANIQSHIPSTNNPHSVTKTQVGLGNVPNTDCTTTSNITDSINKRFVTDTEKTNITHSNRTSLDLVSGTNTGDETSSTIVTKIGDGSKISSTYLPSYVDDVLEYVNLAGFPLTGESSKIYIALDTNITYRWSGTLYVEVSASLALGETLSTAYRGDRGKVAYDHSQIISGNPHNTSKTDIGLNNVINIEQLPSSYLDADITLTSNSDSKIPTQKATKAYADTKIASNVAITGATKTKITYDSKGIVTSGADATTNDISDTSTKRYVTDTQITTWNGKMDIPSKSPTMTYTNGVLTSITYSDGSTKSFTYTNNILTRVDYTKNSVTIRKTLNYTNSVLTSIIEEVI